MKVCGVIVVLALASFFINVSSANSQTEGQCVEEGMGREKGILKSLTPLEQYLMEEMQSLKKLTTEIGELKEMVRKIQLDKDEDTDDENEYDAIEALPSLILNFMTVIGAIIVGKFGWDMVKQVYLANHARV